MFLVSIARAALRFAGLRRVRGRPAERTQNLALAALVGFAVAAGGCTPKIGGSCELSTDCASDGTRVCDTSEPDGYCTVQGCRANQCPDKAACVLLQAAIPGCMYSDRTPSRLGTAYCLIQCNADSDCRDGYICVDPRQPPISGLILDDDQSQKACIPAQDPGVIFGADSGTSTYDAAVCQSLSPVLASEETDAGAADAALLDAGHD